MKTYNLIQGSVQEQFQNSVAKVQMFGGGFANGKTTTGVVKFLKIAKYYPGCNLLAARSTYPKLNDTLRKEVLDWCPPSWVKRLPTKDDNTLVLVNNSKINFRYIKQQGKGQDRSQSNLLSASFDGILVDQIEDPEISEKDFLDLLGRLRGSTRKSKQCKEPNWPDTGPRWLMLTSNPASGWVYRKLARPYHRYLRGIKDEQLIIDPTTGKVAIELFEGSTYTNAANLPPDYIAGLEAAYRGQMYDRYVGGKWAAYEGLVYSAFNEEVHAVRRVDMLRLHEKIRDGYYIKYIEMYDYGLAVPSCYLLAFVDDKGNVHVLDGFYQKEMLLSDQAKEIWRIRDKYGITRKQLTDDIWADPSIFSRKAGQKVVGETIAGIFSDSPNFINMQRANNDIINGITKVQGYLNPQKFHLNPYTGEGMAPFLYFNEVLEFIFNEFSEYMWKKNPTGEHIDVPMDKDDHAMDTIKYGLSDLPEVSNVIPLRPITPPPEHTQWAEVSAQAVMNGHRYG